MAVSQDAAGGSSLRLHRSTLLTPDSSLSSFTDRTLAADRRPLSAAATDATLLSILRLGVYFLCQVPASADLHHHTLSPLNFLSDYNEMVGNRRASVLHDREMQSVMTSF